MEKSRHEDIWAKARKKFQLSDEQITMAKALGLNPKKFGRLANNRQEPWKAPLGDFVEDIYQKKFSNRVS